MRKQIINLLVMLAIAFPMVAAPIEISFSPNSVSFEQHNADAKSYKRKSYSGGSSWGSTTKKKTPSFSLGGSNKKDTKCVFNCGKTTPKVTPSPSTSNTAKGKKGELDAKGIYKKTDSQDVKASGKKAYDAKNPPAPMIAKGKKAPPSISSKPLSDKKRIKIADNTRKELTAPDLRKTRLQSNNARMAKTRSMKRNDVRRLRNERNYWRSRAQYERNYRYRSYNDYGWGYGFYPGQTFHRGWGPFGYGYTRGGVGVADGIIIASLLGHSNIGDRPIPNDYYVDGDFPDVVSVPLGTTFRTIGKQHYLVIPDGMGSFDNVAIPLGSNMYPTDEGTLIQTPYGASIFMPRTKDAYRPNNDYVVPVYAQQEQVYDEYNNGGSFWSYILSWFQ